MGYNYFPIADDVYVEGEDGEIRIGEQDEPEDVDVSQAVDVIEEDVES